MIDTLDHWHWRSMPDQEVFKTSPGLAQKIGRDGSHLPFYGNTVIFDLSPEDKEKVAGLQTIVHDRELGFREGDRPVRCLAEKLDPSTLHMTLHDLMAAPGIRPKEDTDLRETEKNAEELVRQWRDQGDLHMTGTWVFNMANTSLVLGLRPGDHETYLRLCRMYGALQQVRELNYKLCPHITLAYYRPGVYSREVLGLMRSLTFSADTLDITLRMRDLHVMTFASMNEYRILETGEGRG